jgi:molybdopterin-guanine dinucleotide biosynthesis protein A
MDGRMWTAAILAGGQARRLGGLDKSALSVGAQTVLQRQLAVLRDLTPHILMVGRDSAPAGETGVRVVPDRVERSGALGGIYTALCEAPTEIVLVLACDMPFVTAAFIAALVGRAEADAAADAVVPRDARGRHPLCAVYRTRVAHKIHARIDTGALRVLDALGELHVLEVGPDELQQWNSDGRLLLNINTPDDYARAQQP